MAEETKSVQEKSKAKMVPESDIIAFKKGATEREKRLKEELAESKQRTVELEAGLKIAKADTDDEGKLSEIKTYLLEREGTLNERDKEIGKKEKDFASQAEEREREGRVKALAEEHKVEINDITGADDPEKEALRLVAQRLTKEKEETLPPESVFESNTPGSVKKSVKDQTDEEFDASWERQKAEAYAKQ